MKSNTQEHRDATGRLIFCSYIDPGIGMVILEHWEKGCCSRVLIPMGTRIEFDPGERPAKRK